MAFDDIGWYLMVLDSKHWFEYPDFQIWISRRPDSPLRQWDIQIWKSAYSNLKIQIFKFEYPNIQIIVYFPIPSNNIQYDPMPS